MAHEWKDAAHLLCVQLGSPGDILMCTPALRALRVQGPDRRITLLCAPAGAALGPYLPDIDAVLPYAAPWLTEGTGVGCAARLDWIAGLGAQGFDGAVIFTGYRDSALPAALVCQLAGIPMRRRVGFDDLRRFIAAGSRTSRVQDGDDIVRRVVRIIR